jgi:hypothetical protein
VDFAADDKQRREGGRDTWLVASSPYPHSDSPVLSAAGSVGPARGTKQPSVQAPPATERGRIKVVEFDQGREQKHPGSRSEKDDELARSRQYAATEPAAPARPIKIVEFDQAAAPPREFDAASGGRRIKIIDFDALQSGGSK